MIKEMLAECQDDLCLKNEINLLQKTKEPITLFGAGCTSEFIVEQMYSQGIYPKYFCDNDVAKRGKEIAGLKVFSPEDLHKLQNGYYYITTQLYYREIKQQLLDLGIAEEKILQCDIIYQFPWEKKVTSFLEKQGDKLESFYNRLQDAKSKMVFENRWKFLLTRRREYMTSIHDDLPYFDTSIFDPNKIRNYIDLGTYTGDTIEQFCKLNHSYRHVWGFEPDKALVKEANRNLSQYRSITIAPYATSDFDGSMRVQSGLGVMQTIDNQYESDVSTEQIFDVCKLDTYFADQNVESCFVKMDIEGAEMVTLRGMERFMKRNAPIMAICIYHKLEDIVEVPELLSGLENGRGGVKYYLRHYSDNQTETVLFVKIGEK